MSNTIVNITLQSKSDPTINIQTTDGGSVTSNPNFIPTINFVATGPVGAQGAQGLQGADGSGGSELTNNSIQTSHIINGAVTGAKIANYTITGSNIAGSAISTHKIINQAVTTAKLADNSVTAAKIADGAITNELIDVFADFAISKDKIEYLGLDASVIALDAIITSKIKDRNVTGQKICSDPDLDGEVKCHKMKIKGLSPGLITGPDSDALHIKSNSTLDFLNTSDTIITSLDQSGNLTILGTVDGRNISTDGSKLDTISNNAQPNVKSNWNETDSNSDAFIQNKPTIPVNTDTTYNIQCVDGDNSNEQKIRLAASGSGSGDDDVVLEAGTGLSISRSGDKITFTNTVTDTDTVLTTEQVQDIVGAMFSSNTETRISVTYDNSDGTIDFVVNDIPVDLTVSGDGTIHIDNVPTLNQNTTGNAATATALASGNQTISGDLTIDGDIILDGNQSINSLGASGSLNVNPASVLNLGTASTDSVNIGRQSSTIPVNIYTGTSTASAVLTNSTITLNHPTTINSDLAITGTVDGRDIATDGTKLDGIATGADVTTVTANTTNADFPVVFHDSNALHDDGASDFTYNPSTNNLKIGKLTANSSGSTLAGIVSVGTQDGDDRLHIARYRDTSTIYPFAHIYAGLDGLSSRCGFKIVVRNNSGTLGDGLKIDGNTKEVTFSGVINGTKLNTGQGDNELYAMNQDVETSDNVTFASVTTTGDIQVSGNDIKDSSGTAAITFNGSGFMSTPQLTVNNHAIVSKTLTVGGTGNPAVTIATKKVTLTTAQCNALHTTPVTVAPAAGADTVIVPVSGMIRVDRAATQTNSSADLNFHYSGTTGAYFNSSMVHFRRFMWNETGDRVFNIAPLAIERSQSLTEDVNKDLVVSVDSALTNNCFTSVTIFLTYHVFDIS